ncbi:MAG: tetratricopeptide repeat protein [Candidatus Heimdallarchaeota archaeon]|nr:tetratricopeptide repeat protein [Candidatus Heimdallarchaeota archaeon]
MKEKIEINTMTARNVYSSESLDFVRTILKKFCNITIPDKAKEIHKQDRSNDYTDEFRIYGTSEFGIKFHSYYKVIDKTVKIPTFYTVSSETFGSNDLWAKFTISSQDGLILELESNDSKLIQKIVAFFETEYGYCRKQSEEELFDEIIHEIRVHGFEDDGEKGIKLGLKAIKIYPNDYWARFYLGCSYALNKQHKKAIENLSIATQKDPKSHDAFYNLGKSYLEINNLAKAKEAMLKALLLANDSHVINYFLAVILEKNNEKQEAIKHYQKAIKLAPENHPEGKRGFISYLKEAKEHIIKLKG